jgi:O-acetyl-ADP-ribose deacetylase (regulator of RNase III)
MIRYTQGNLLDANADALVNTVNEVGVMGKGIALQFRDAFPDSARVYEHEAKAKRVHVGTMLVTAGAALLGPRLIIHFPTKKNWRQPSQLSWIREGLLDLVRVIRQEEIRSIALPPLGCGNGGLDWALVRPEIERALGVLSDVDVTVFEPTGDYYNAPKRSGVEELSPARALVVELVRRYAVLGLECSILEVQKLAWFLDRSMRRLSIPDVLKLEFTAQKFGPYSDRLRFLLDNLDGSYLHSERRLADAKPLDVLWFDDSRADVVSTYLASTASEEFLPALNDASAVINGFESPLGMELLATVDWVISREQAEATVAGVRAAIGNWPAGRAAAQRKQRIFNDRLVGLALDRLASTRFV